MTRSGKVRTDVNPALWKAGWYWLYVLVGGPILGIVAIFAIGEGPGLAIGTILFFGAPVFAMVGLVYVRMNLGSVLDSGTESVREASEEVARLDGDDNETFSLVTKAGSSLPLLPKPKRKVATLVVNDSLLLVHDSAELDLPDLRWRVGQSTNEFYFDQISGVNYEPHSKREGGEFWVNLSDGHGESWESVTDATPALNAVQDRVRAYKSV